jgi:hypothetical protein
VSLPFNVGVGGAMRTAFLYAHREGYGALVQVDADGQHDPADLDHVLNGLADADVVVGTRFHPDSTYFVGGPRRWAMRLLVQVSLSRMNKGPDLGPDLGLPLGRPTRDRAVRRAVPGRLPRRYRRLAGDRHPARARHPRDAGHDVLPPDRPARARTRCGRRSTSAARPWPSSPRASTAATPLAGTSRDRAAPRSGRGDHHLRLRLQPPATRGPPREVRRAVAVLLGSGAVLRHRPGGAGTGSAACSASRTPVNLLFFVTVVLLILVSVQLSYELSRHEARIRRLAEEVALLAGGDPAAAKDQQRDGD